MTAFFKDISNIPQLQLTWQWRRQYWVVKSGKQRWPGKLPLIDAEGTDREKEEGGQKKAGGQ